MSYPQQSPMPGATASYPLCSRAKRLGAYLLEVVLIIVTLVIGWLIWYLIAWSKGQSPAKQVLKLRCVKADTGSPATWGTMALREVVGKMLLGIVPFYTLISLIVILVDDRYQGLWDKVAGTVVVDES